VPSQLLHAGLLLYWFSTLKMEVICSSETSVYIRTTRRYIPEDYILITTTVRASNPTSCTQVQTLCRIRYFARLNIPVTLDWTQGLSLYSTIHHCISVPCSGFVQECSAKAVQRICVSHFDSQPCLYKFHRFTLLVAEIRRQEYLFTCWCIAKSIWSRRVLRMSSQSTLQGKKVDRVFGNETLGI
jgi:hypothetical protein